MSDFEDEDTYELDLDATTGSVESVIDDAVAAVDRHREGAAPDTDPPADVEPEPIAAADPAPATSPSADAGGDAALRDRLMRTLADFDNFRKRTEREIKAARRSVEGEVLADFVGVIDNLERALQAGGGVDELKLGVEMILRQKRDILSRRGVTRVDAVGQPFDPTLHEAVSREEGEVELPTVVTELQAGYLHHDRLLRPAMVVVAMPGAGGAADDAD
ncbi:MAG: nucleotide exchange factor GrpE [Acidobacteriota bacterium]